MSCPKNRQNINKKPKRTNYMVKKNKYYVWDYIKNNPNIYCWLPQERKKSKIHAIDISEANIQDIPRQIPENYKDIIEKLAESAERAKQRKMASAYKKGDVVSYDEPSKYPLVKQFIVDNNLKLYGGAALNMYMPDDEKFYDEGAIPDYDFYSPKPWEHAVYLANILYKAGYKYTEVKAGIHKGTYKVYANLWPVADITYMEPSLFNRLEIVKKEGGMSVVAPAPLMASMYKELSYPGGDVSRWPKVAYRQKLFTMYANPSGRKITNCDIFIDDKGVNNFGINYTNILTTTRLFCDDNNLLYYGPSAYNTYIEVGGGKNRILVSHYNVFSEDAANMIQKLFTKLLKIQNNLEIRTIQRLWREIDGMVHYIITPDGNTICSITNLKICIPYVNVLGRKLAAIDYIKYDLYSTISFNQDKIIVKDARCKLKYLNKIQAKYYIKNDVSEMEKSPFQRFVTNCMGPVEHGLKRELLSRWIKKVEDTKKIKKYRGDKDDILLSNVKGKHIRVYPKEKLNMDCMVLDENNCNYPCTWINNKCIEIPKGAYHPEDIDL